MIFKDLIKKLADIMCKKPLTESYRIEVFDKDNWQYDLIKVEVCHETKRIIFGLKFVGERKNGQR